MIPRTGRVLALDWGEVRLGVAASDETQMIAGPLATLVRRAGRRFPMKSFRELIENSQAVGVVVGLPLDPEGLEGESARAAREIADQVARMTGLPVELVDERFTTARALRSVREMGGTTRGRQEDVDAVAATVLLQHFLDSRRAP
jgi:putative Holliday junction resolvase